MFKTKIIYKLMAFFIIFSVVLLLPYTLTILNQAKYLLEQEESLHPPETEEYAKAHRYFIPSLLEKIVPFAFYTFILSMFFALFFMRRLIFSIKELLKGSQALKNGDLDARVEIGSDDELGAVAKAFNEMASALKERTLELQKKDMYVNAMLDPLWVVDEDNKIVDINPAFTNLFGHKKEEVLGASIYDFFDDKNAAIMRRELVEKREKGLPSIYEISIFTKDGEQIPVLISGSPIYSGGKVVRKIGILKDFRQQSCLKKELQESRDYIETIMDSIEDQLIVIDRNYKILRANRVALANAMTPMIGEFCYAAIHHSPTPCWTDGQDCPVQKVFSIGRNYSTTHRHFTEGGSVRYYEIAASPITDSSGNILQAIELVRDVTDRVRREEDIFLKNRELVAVNTIAKILSRSLKQEEIYNNVLNKVIEFMDMDGGVIFFVDEHQKEMVCQYHKGISDDYVRLMERVRLGDDIPGKVAVTGQSVTTSDLSNDTRVERSVIKHSGIKGYGCFPIRGKERVLGVICIFSIKMRTFTDEEENVLNAIGEMTGISLENIKLYEKMKQLYETQRSRRADEHAKLLGLSARLGAAVELKGVMGPVVNIIKESFKAEFVWLFICDNEGNLVLKSSTAFSEKAGEIIYRNGLSTIEGYSMEKRQPTVIHNISAADKFYILEELRALSCQDVMSVPLYISEKPVGVFAIYYHGIRNFTEEEIHFLMIIANFLAVAIQRSDYYSKALDEKGLSDAILQSVADSLITVDENGRVISVNKAFEKIGGIMSGEAIGRPLCDLFMYSEKNNDFRTLLGECLKDSLSGNSLSKEATLFSYYGMSMAVQVSTYPVLQSDGITRGAVTVLRDISREKEIDQMKTELIRSVSHEFRTPLSAIVGMTEMIMDGDITDDKVNKYLGTILSEGIRLSNMVSDLLSIARIESGKESLKYKPINMAKLIKEVVATFAAVKKEKKATLRHKIKGAGNIIGDEEKIKQLLLNFLDNSLSFSDNGCTIEIEVRTEDGDVRIKVEDNGWGIPEEDLKHLTERFYRGMHGQRVKGTGLGLSLCYEIVKMHGGEMEIKSSPGKGTEVVVTLPAGGRDG